MSHHKEEAARYLTRADTMAKRDPNLGYDAPKIIALAALAEAHLKFEEMRLKGNGK